VAHLEKVTKKSLGDHVLKKGREAGLHGCESGESRIGAARAGDWPGSSWPLYFGSESSLLVMDRVNM
jgi:hypothetical protein